MISLRKPLVLHRSHPQARRLRHEGDKADGGQHHKGTWEVAHDDRDDEKKKGRAVVEATASRRLDDDRPEGERAQQEAEMLGGMRVVATQSPLIDPGQMPKDESATKQHEYGKRIYKRLEHAIEAKAEPCARYMLSRRRRECPEEGKRRAAPNEEGWRHHHQQDVLEHVCGEKLITDGVDQRAERQQENRHARGKTCDPPAVQHLLGAYFFVQSPGADRVADALPGQDRTAPKGQNSRRGDAEPAAPCARASLSPKPEISRDKEDDA